MDKKTTKSWWDKTMEDGYFTDMIFCFSRPDLIEKFNLSSKSSILEIGFGYGRETSQFCKISENVYGIDLAATAKDIAYKNILNLNIKNTPILDTYDGTRLNFPNKKFDFIYSCFVIQHMSKQSAIDLINEATRVLKEDGNILFEFFGDPSFFKDGMEDVFSGTPNLIEENLPYGGMYNNSFNIKTINEIVEKTNGKIKWIDEQPIDTNFCNYWVCITR